MPPQFLDNPYEIEEWETDDDLELSRDEEWLTLPIPIELLPDWTPGPFIPAEEGSDEDLFSDESYDWFVDNSDEWIDHNSDDDDDDDDEEYNIDDEPYEESEVFEELENDIDESGGSSNASFNDLYIDERDEDDDSIIDYVTYPLPSENNTKTTTTESNSNNLSSDTETD